MQNPLVHQDHPFQPRLGLALGSGSARGWAHIGVIRRLEQAGLRPDLVCGTSIGALVGAAYAAGALDELEKWVLGLSRRDIVSLMDFGLPGGILKGARLMNFFRDTFGDAPIEDLPLPFSAVATALHTGTEVWLRTGPVLAAVRASIALPGLFTPVRRDGRILVDGGLVNPVPVSLARAMDADIVFAVDLNSDIMGRHLRTPVESSPVAAHAEGRWHQRIQYLSDLWRGSPPPSRSARPRLPSTLDILAGSLNIMQTRITRSRMAGDPPEAVITPRLAHLALLDFHRAGEAIEAGQQAVEEALPLLRINGLVPAPD